MKGLKLSPNVSNLVMPENLRVGLLVSEYRKKCLKGGCSFEYAGFAFGQSPFHVPEPLTHALGTQAENGHYSSAEGIYELRQSIVDFNRRYFNLNVPVDRVAIGSGTKNIIFTIFSMIKGPVIIPSPSWIGYFPQLKLLGKKYHTYYLQAESGFKIEPGKLDSLIADISPAGEPPLLILNNPHNPTGALYSKQELSDLTVVCKKHNAFVLSDEIYALSTYDFPRFVSMGKIFPEGTFVTNGISKDRSAGGYRLGSCIFPEKNSDELLANFKKVAATMYTNVSTPTQLAAISAYKPNDAIDDYINVTRNIHRIMGTNLSREFNKIEGINATVPHGGFYFYADFNGLKRELNKKGITTSNQLGGSLLSHPFHIATVTGDAVMACEDDFGARIAFVDYNGKKAFENFKKAPPKNKKEEAGFVKRNAPNMVTGVQKLRNYVKWLFS